MPKRDSRATGSSLRQEPPRGDLTPVQHEIMVLVWEAGESGLSVAHIWQTIAGRRDVTRTTVLNLVDRLEKRGWLERQPVGDVFHYKAAVDRAATESRLATGFVSEFFGGSLAHLVQSLLGADEVSPADLERMRRLLADEKKRRAERNVVESGRKTKGDRP